MLSVDSIADQVHCLVCNGQVMRYRSNKIQVLSSMFKGKEEILKKETTVFNLQNMFRHSYVIFSCK